MNHKHIKIVIEKHTDGYVAYPVGLKGVEVEKKILIKKHGQMCNLL